MPTLFDAFHVRLSEYDLEQLADGEVLVMTPEGRLDVSLIVDAFASESASKEETQ